MFLFQPTAHPQGHLYAVDSQEPDQAACSCHLPPLPPLSPHSSLSAGKEMDENREKPSPLTAIRMRDGKGNSLSQPPLPVALGRSVRTVLLGGQGLLGVQRMNEGTWSTCLCSRTPPHTHTLSSASAHRGQICLAKWHHYKRISLPLAVCSGSRQPSQARLHLRLSGVIKWH